MSKGSVSRILFYLTFLTKEGVCLCTQLVGKIIIDRIFCYVHMGKESRITEKFVCGYVICTIYGINLVLCYVIYMWQASGKHQTKLPRASFILGIWIHMGKTEELAKRKNVCN